jgi:hypothetical protein
MESLQPGKTYFAVSDVHSFYTPLKKALREAGFRRDDPNHVLIVCGDIFDRGYETNQVLRFLKSLPKERRVLIRGNHERLLRDCYRRGSYYDYDMSNGTVITMCQLAGKDPNWREAYYSTPHESSNRSEFMALWKENYEKPFKSRRIANVIDWMWSDDWVDYYELGDFVFVHSWVPTKQGPFDDRKHRFTEVADPDWRNLGEPAWDDASWGCPWRKYLDGALPEGKTIVCGHWHVQDFHMHLGHDADGYKNRDIYFGDRLIALDAATALSPHVCNVLVIKDGRCYDKHRKALN